MNPIDPGEQYGQLKVYGAGQPEYTPLPTRVDDESAALSKWELSLEERRALMDGARVCLRHLTFGQALQPVYLFIEGTEGDPYGAVGQEAT